MTYQIGDTLRINPDRWGRRPIHEDGLPRWHALYTLPMAEKRVCNLLDRRAVYAFFPVEPNQTKTGKEIKTLPGLVFAKFLGRAIIHRVTDIPGIRGAITMQGGEWAVLRPEDIQRLHKMRSKAEAIAHQEAQAKLIKPGDSVKVLWGLLGEGQTVEVLKVGNGRATFRLEMLGASREVEAGLASLRKID